MNDNVCRYKTSQASYDCEQVILIKTSLSITNRSISRQTTAWKWSVNGGRRRERISHRVQRDLKVKISEISLHSVANSSFYSIKVEMAHADASSHGSARRNSRR